MDNEKNQIPKNKTDFNFLIIILESIAVTMAVVAVVAVKTLFPDFFEDIKAWYQYHFSEEIHIENVIGSFPDYSELSIGEYEVKVE